MEPEVVALSKEKSKVKKPRIGQKVYCIYEDSILAQEVFMIGKDSFLLYPYGTLEDSWEWGYEDYEETWFTSLSRAKKRLLETVYQEEGEKLYVEKLSDDYYEVRIKI